MHRSRHGRVLRLTLAAFGGGENYCRRAVPRFVIGGVRRIKFLNNIASPRLVHRISIYDISKWRLQ
jgi:hypothetical protein